MSPGVTGLRGMPLREEPSERVLSGDPIAWRRSLMFEFGGGSLFLPFYLYQELEGVTWNCPECGEPGAVLRRAGGTYWFWRHRCRHKREMYEVDGDALSESLGLG